MSKGWGMDLYANVDNGGVTVWIVKVVEDDLGSAKQVKGGEESKRT